MDVPDYDFVHLTKLAFNLKYVNPELAWDSKPAL